MVKMSPKRSRSASRSGSRVARKRNGSGYRSKSGDRKDRRRKSDSRERSRKQAKRRSPSRDKLERRGVKRDLSRSRSRNKRSDNSFRDEIMKKLSGGDDRNQNTEKYDGVKTSKTRRSPSREFKSQFRRRRSPSDHKSQKNKNRRSSSSDYKSQKNKNRRSPSSDDKSQKIKNRRSPSHNSTQQNRKKRSPSTDYKHQNNKIRRSLSRDYRDQKNKNKRSPSSDYKLQKYENRKESPRSERVSNNISIQEKLLKLAQTNHDINMTKSKTSNSSALGKARRSRSRSNNNNVKNANQVPITKRGVSRARSRSRCRESSRGGKRFQDNTQRRRSNSRTASIQEKLLMLSQTQSKAKENFAPQRKVGSNCKDEKGNANQVPIVRKDRARISEMRRSRSRSGNMRAGRSRSRSENRIARARVSQAKPLTRGGRSPPGIKKENKDLSKINNRLLNLVHDQYGDGVEDSREQSEEFYGTEKAKSKKDKKKKKKKKKKSSSSESDDLKESSSHKKKKKKKGKKNKKGQKDADDELNASIAELEAKTKKAPLRSELKEERNSRVPMTKEEWDKKQSVIRREFDSDTGRVRLVRGGGEIMEECVSRDRQREINRQATLGDGASFQRDIKSRLGVKDRLY